MDEDGYFWFQGRVDDVIMTSGERVGPFEVESKLLNILLWQKQVLLESQTRFVVKSLKHLLRYVTDIEPSDELIEEIRQFVKNGLAAHAAPREIEFRDKLPKTRSGKIMRTGFESMGTRSTNWGSFIHGRLMVDRLKTRKNRYQRFFLVR